MHLSNLHRNIAICKFYFILIVRLKTSSEAHLWLVVFFFLVRHIKTLEVKIVI